jgi:hypothetical protein
MADEWGFLEMSTPWCQGALILRTPSSLGINQHKAAAKKKKFLKNHFFHDLENKNTNEMLSGVSISLLKMSRPLGKGKFCSS